MNKKSDHWVVFRWMENVFPFLFPPSLSPNVQNWRNAVLSEHTQRPEDWAAVLGVGNPCPRERHFKLQ